MDVIRSHGSHQHTNNFNTYNELALTA